jgi:hypothetical protein
MPFVSIMLQDDQGNPLPDTQQFYPLEGSCDTLNQIEAAVENLRKQALPDLEQALLNQAQERFVTEQKKGACTVKAAK